MARRALVDQWRHLAAAAIGICQIRRRRGAGASGGRRSRADAGACGAAERFRRAAQTGNGSSQLIGFSMVSIFLRSLVYNVLFYLVLAFWVILGIPTYLMPRWAIMNIARYWARSSIWLMRVICNTKVEYRGLEKIPQGPLIVASKHQSMWETFALLQFFDQPLFILKRELKWIPLFGWYLKKSNMIGIDRSAGGRALLEMAHDAGEEVRRGRQLVIFPEGTRRPVDAPPDYKSGIAQIYVDCGVSCLPVALNSGLFWPRRTFMRYPGTLVVEFLDPLPPGLKRKDFIARIMLSIEDATNRLVEAGRQEQAQLLGRAAVSASAT